MPKPAQNSEEGCPSGMKFPDTAIAHANLRVAGSDIMMSDSAPTEMPTTLALRWYSTRKTSTKANAGLITRSKRKIEMDWQETFWAHGFGKVSDRYGVPWMINVVKQQQPTE